MAISRLSLKISLPIILVSVLAIGLTVFLNIGKLERTLSDVEESRLRFTLSDLRENLETGLDLGLPVKGLGNAQAAIDFEAKQHPEILSIDVIDNSGAVVFHTGGAAPASGQAWRQAIATRARDWQARDSDAMVAGTKMSNNLGVTAGAIVLRYSRANHEQFMAGVTRSLVLTAAGAVAVTTILLLLGINLLLERMGRGLSAMEDALEGKGSADTINEEASALVTQVRLSANDAIAQIAAAEQQLAQVDR